MASLPLINGDDEDFSCAIEKYNLCTIHEPAIKTWSYQVVKEKRDILIQILPAKDNKLYSMDCEATKMSSPSLYDKVCYVYTNVWYNLPLSKDCKPLPSIKSGRILC